MKLMRMTMPLLRLFYVTVITMMMMRVMVLLLRLLPLHGRMSMLMKANMNHADYDGTGLGGTFIL